MEKIRIKIVILGNIPRRFDIQKIKQWNSNLFLISEVDTISLTCNSDADNDWSYSDESIQRQLPKPDNADFLVALTNVPLESNWYTRRLTHNRVSFTFYEIKELLISNNIPLENIVLRALYAYSLNYIRFNNEIPPYGSTDFTHDETRGCLYDMNGIKSDLIESCNRPTICKECEHNLSVNKVPLNLISNTNNELKKIQKELYYRWIDFIKLHPILSVIISLISIVSFGVFSSLIATLIYEKLIK